MKIITNPQNLKVSTMNRENNQNNTRSSFCSPNRGSTTIDHHITPKRSSACSNFSSCFFENEEEEELAFEPWTVDCEEQKAQLEYFEAKKRESPKSHCSCTDSKSLDEKIQGDKGYLEVYKGYVLPLIGAKKTWEAIDNGYFNIANCFECNEELSCVFEASYVVCSCCTTVSPVAISDFESGNTKETPFVGVGVRTDEIRQRFGGR